MPFRELNPRDLYAVPNAILVDVRSPCEFSQARIPGAHNIPLLSDEERAEVGIIYKDRGEMVARRHALRIISPKIPDTIDRILGLRRHGGVIVVYCWRGGLRSESVASLLSVAGVECLRITGGYKAWRNFVLEQLNAFRFPGQVFVLHGLTGTGKTEILAALARRGLQVVDLESLAVHRGSVFGGLGLPEQPTQKNFDGELWALLKELKGEPVFLEAESKKIGRLSLPDSIMSAIADGAPILVTGSMTRRVGRIVDDYLGGNCSAESMYLDRAIELMRGLKERLGKQTVEMLEELVRSGETHGAVEHLLVHYYDPLYSRHVGKAAPFLLEVDGDDPEQAADVISTAICQEVPRIPQK